MNFENQEEKELWKSVAVAVASSNNASDTDAMERWGRRAVEFFRKSCTEKQLSNEDIEFIKTVKLQHEAIKTGEQRGYNKAKEELENRTCDDCIFCDEVKERLIHCENFEQFMPIEIGKCDMWEQKEC